MSEKIINSNIKAFNSKIVLGTAQFGLKYGINNKTGLVDECSLNSILNYAINSGIQLIDTAYNYGNSEERLGVYLSSLFKSGFKIGSIVVFNIFMLPSIYTLFLFNSFAFIKISSLFNSLKLLLYTPF